MEETAIKVSGKLNGGQEQDEAVRRILFPTLKLEQTDSEHEPRL